MMEHEITYEQYLESLNIVLLYQKQILNWDKKVKQIGITPKEVFLQTAIRDLPYGKGISFGAQDSLLKNGIVTIEELLENTPEEFEGKIKLGKKYRLEIVEFMKKNNLKFQ